ncbi:MAG: dockerin type I repeat-containing protein [Clostridia bacterium]|nr:dockerin type I repeat-containing protein [Clostridia bacterium]
MKKILTVTLVLLLTVALQSTASVFASDARQMGDVVYDGIINIKDIMAVRDHVFGETLIGDNFTAADMSFRGKVNIEDILFIRDIMFGERSSPFWPGVKPPFSGTPYFGSSPVPSISIYFNSYADLTRDIYNGFPEDVMAECDFIDEVAVGQRGEKGAFQNFLSKRQAKNIIIPNLREEPMPLFDKEMGILLSSSQIWFYPNLCNITFYPKEEGVSRMSIYYLDGLGAEQLNVANEKGFMQVYKEIYPHWPDFADQDYIAKTYEVDFALKERTVKAVARIHASDASIMSIDFIYDNVRVNIEGNINALTPELLAGLDFRLAEMK